MFKVIAEEQEDMLGRFGDEERVYPWFGYYGQGKECEDY